MEETEACCWFPYGEIGIKKVVTDLLVGKSNTESMKNQRNSVLITIEEKTKKQKEKQPEKC